MFCFDFGGPAFVKLIHAFVVFDFRTEFTFCFQLRFDGEMFFILVFAKVHKWFFVFSYLFLLILVAAKYHALETFQVDTVVAKCIVEIHLIISPIPFQFDTEVRQV